MLSNWGREISRRLKNWNKIVLVKDPKLKKKRIRLRIYGQVVLPPLKKVWGILNYPCGKRLKPFLKEIVPVLEKYREIVIDPATREKILEMSAATIDRLLKGEREKWQVNFVTCSRWK